MVDDLPYGPAAQPVRRIELALGQARDSRTEMTRRIAEPGEQFIARVGIRHGPAQTGRSDSVSQA